MGFAVKAEVITWLRRARKRKLQVGNSIDSLKGLRRYRGNRKRSLRFLQNIGKGKNNFSVFCMLCETVWRDWLEL